MTPLEVIGDVLRSMICAAPGCELIAGDFSQIESRILSTLAGEQWKLDAFREYDRTGDPALDVYCKTATRILGREVTPADDADRQIGKKGDLSFGYGGGLGAWRRFDSSNTHGDAEVEEFKIAWRDQHPATVRFWHALERSLHKAMRTGERVVGQKALLACEFAGGDLLLILPSGRRIVFPEARFAPGRFGKPQVTFKNKDKNDDGSGGEGAWGDKDGWYGLFTARAVSGIARDLLAAAMQRIEAAGYAVILTVHDEIIAEVPAGFGSIEEFRALMTEPPAWAAAMEIPIVAEVWRGQRYGNQPPTAPKADGRTDLGDDHAPARDMSIPDDMSIPGFLQRASPRAEILPIYASEPGADGKDQFVIPGAERVADPEPSMKTDADAEAAEFLEQLRPGGPWLLNAFDPNVDNDKGRAVTADNADAVRAFVRKWDGKRNIYYSVNPTRAALSKKAAKTDIAAVEYLLADLDPNHGETPEAAKARYLAQLDGAGVPVPTAIVDSGNGIQGLWRLRERIELAAPVAKEFPSEAKEAIRAVESRMAAMMKSLGSKAGTQNIDRILRLPGTANLPTKAKLRSGRTPCRSKLIAFNGAAYALDAFRETASTAAGSGNGADAGGTAELTPALLSLLSLPDPGVGQAVGGYDTRSELMFKFVTAALRGGVARAAIAAAMLAADNGSAIHAHCAEQPGGAAAYIERQIERALEKAPAKKEAGPKTLASARASTFEMEALDWFWSNRFALGKIGLIVGLPDEGKGQLLCYMVAQTTRPGAWPCGEGRAPQGNVVFFTAEDDISDTVAPRLAAAGADRDRVEIVKMVRDDAEDRMFNLATDLDLLRKKIVEVGDVRLVLIDPISAYLGVGKVDSFRTTDVRAVLGPLVELAAELRVAVVAVMHFNKKIDITNALLRISDSLAFAAVARHVYGVIDDIEHERKLLVRAKNNVAIKNKNQTLAFRFEAREVGTDRRTGKPIWAPYIVFEDAYVDVSAMEAMQAAASNKSPTARDAAKKFLFDMLAGGPVLSSEIEETAEANGISVRTLFRAKADLKVLAKRDKGKDGLWRWQLPDDFAVKN